MKKIFFKLKTGFTLIETLVAISILTAAVAGPLVMSIKNIGTANTSQDQLVAFYLGQEVIEYVRNVRDTNLMRKNLDDAGFDWMEGLRENCVSVDNSKACSIDVINNKICVIGGACTGGLKFSDGYYSAVTNGASFTRTVKIKNPVDGNADEAQVDVEVSWKSKYGKKLKTMHLQDHIFNWRE